MAAQIYNLFGQDSFTRRAGTAPAWHGLGGETPADASLDVWARNAGMDFEILGAPVQFDAAGALATFGGRRVLYRSDNAAPLGLVSDRYKVVQPREVLEFFRDLTQAGGYQLETAGVLGEGGKYWALATNGQSVNLSGDVIKPYLLLATACDGSLATTADFTSVRVVCQNTLSMAVDGATTAIKVRHTTKFDARDVKRQLGIDETFEQFVAQVDRLATRHIADRDAADVLWQLFAADQDANNRTPQALPKQTRDKIEGVWSLYQGAGHGAELATARGTAWGVLNAVTQYVDHETRAHNRENRLASAWFGAGKALKNRAFEMLAA
jgi:phage/plasmid-like protein (TIGR03299 family)